MAVCGRPRKDAAQYLRWHGTRLRCVRRLLHGSPRTIGLSAIALILVAACASLALPATAAPASTGPQTAPAGQLSAPTAGGSNDYFNSDSCTSSAFCMAVGGYSQSGHLPGLSEMFSGGSWVAEPVPSPAQGVNVFANEVSCASPASCLFVGDHWAGKRGPAANLAEAWNGSSWRIVATTGPARTSYSFLDDVSCPTTRFCLAIGGAGTVRKFQDTAYTWDNGTTWRRIPVPSPSRARNSELGGLACSNSKNCMAVGNYTSASGHNVPFAARWHDGRWKLLSTPAVPRQRFTEFQGISCPTATRCVAVGNTEDNTRNKYYYAFAETWNGGKWRVSTLRRSSSSFRRRLMPGTEPLLRLWLHISWTEHICHTPDRDLERPVLGDPACCPDHCALFRRLSRARVLRYPVRL